MLEYLKKPAVNCFACIPTTIIGRLNDTELSENEKRIIELVINRFLCALDKPYEYDETRYEFTVNGEVFRLTDKIPTSLGWRRYSGKDRGEESDNKPKYAVSCRFRCPLSLGTLFAGYDSPRSRS